MPLVTSYGGSEIEFGANGKVSKSNSRSVFLSFSSEDLLCKIVFFLIVKLCILSKISFIVCNVVLLFVFRHVLVL